MSLMQTIRRLFWRQDPPSDLPPLNIPPPEVGERIDRKQRELAQQLLALRRAEQDRDIRQPWERGR